MIFYSFHVLCCANKNKQIITVRWVWLTSRRHLLTEKSLHPWFNKKYATMRLLDFEFQGHNYAPFVIISLEKKTHAIFFNESECLFCFRYLLRVFPFKIINQYHHQVQLQVWFCEGIVGGKNKLLTCVFGSGIVNKWCCLENCRFLGSVCGVLDFLRFDSFIYAW